MSKSKDPEWDKKIEEAKKVLSQTKDTHYVLDTLGIELEKKPMKRYLKKVMKPIILVLLDNGEHKDG